MKKITLLVSALALSSSFFGQSQRLTLVEEFTQASCGPCAAQNPAFNALVAPNETAGKIISIKYQTSWPGVDPMNAQTASEVAARVTYYGVSGVPNIEYDGTVLADAAPSALSQNGINTEYAVSSPFTISATHSFSPDFSTVTINATITATQAISGTLIGQIALVERQINFATAPGTNGETDFYNVMRKMYPNASGTVLPTTWTVGQSQTITITAAAVPQFIYDLNEVAVVVFVQDNATQNVKQAGFSQPIVLPPSTNDAGISATTGLNAISCATSVTPSVTVKNYAAASLTSCTINYQLDGGAIMTQAWTGSLATNATAVATLPAITVGVGSHTLTSWTSAPNGGNDYHIVNNYNNKGFSIVGAATSAPLVEGFVSTTFPPTNWVVDDPDASYPWMRAATGGFGIANGSGVANFYADPAGNIEDLYAKPVDLTSSLAHAGMSFDVAYSQYSSENDKLQVHVSTDCGATWTQVYSKQGTTLSTTGDAITSNFIPTSAQWRTENVDLTSYLNQTNVLVRFRATSAYGNNLFVDNINIAAANGMIGIAENTSNVSDINVYPNPVNDNANVEFTLVNSTNVKVSMYNTLGELVYSNLMGEMSSGNHNIKIDATNLNSGVYFITLNVNDGTITKKVTINK